MARDRLDALRTPTVLYLRVDLGGEHLNAGGSVTHTTGVMKGFVSNGWSVVCASSALVALLQQCVGITFYRLCMPGWMRPLRWKLNSLLSNVFFTIRILRAAAQHPDITYVYQRHSPFSIIGVLVSRWLSVPLILEYNGSEVWMARHWDRTSRFSLRWLLQFCEQMSLRGARAIVVVSQASAAQVQQTPRLTAQIIYKPNGVDIEEFDPARLHTARMRVRDQYGYTNRFVFGFIGTFSPWHGINQLARMIPAVIAREPNAAFLLIGDGPLHTWLSAQLQTCGMSSEQVVFTGTVPQAAAKEYLAACDAFLLPTQPNADGSTFFGSPIKLFEYMSMAKPIIASDIAQVAQILSGIGILVHPADTNGFVDAACAVMHHTPEMLHARGQAARDSVSAHATWHEHVKTIITALRHPETERVT